MQNLENNNLSGGLDTDTAYVSLPPNRYVHANDVEFINDDESQLTFAKSKLGTTLRAVVPTTTQLKQIWRFRTYCDSESQVIDPSLSTNSNFTIRFDDEFGNTIQQVTVSFTAPTPRTFANLKSLVEAAFTSAGISTTVSIEGDPLQVLYGTITIDNRNANPYIVTGTATTISFTEGIYGDRNMIMLQDEYNANIQLIPLAYTNLQNIGFILSVAQDNTFTEIGTVNEYTIDGSNNWTYTRLLRTKDFVLSQTQPIDFNAEQQNDDIYALYFTQKGLKPKCVYVPSLAQDSCLRYRRLEYQTPTRGFYNITNTDEQTNSQLINNIVHCEYKETIESGGALTTGGKAYAVRCGINSASTTAWSVISKTVPVIALNSASKLAWVAIEGTPIGQPTSKINVITINNAKQNVFTFCEVAVIEFTSEQVGDAYIIGKFDITADSFDIVHTGNENYIPIAIEEFINTDPVILSAKSQEIKKQRINYASVEIGANESLYETIAENATLGTTVFEVQNVGKLPSTTGNQRFLGTKKYDLPTVVGGTTLYANSLSSKVVLPLVSVPISGVTPSSYTQATGTYTVNADDGNLLQFIFKAKGEVVLYDESVGIISRTTPSAFNMYFVVFKAGVEVGSILMGERNNIPRAPSNYIIDVNQVINIPVILGDVLEFKIQLFATNGSDTYFFTYTDGITLRLNSTTQSTVNLVDTQIGEYQIPFNVANRSGYMANDYRFAYMQFHLKNGFTTAAYPIGKWSEDGGVTNVRGLHKTVIPNNLTPFTDNLTTASRKVFNYAISVNNINITSIKSQLEGISFWVSDDIGIVAGTGLYVTASETNGDTYSTNFEGSVPVGDIRRNFGQFLSHDTVDKDIQFATGDVIRTFGGMNTLTRNENFKSGTNNISKIYEYLGSISNLFLPTNPTLTIEDAALTSFNNVSNIIYNTTNTTPLKLSTSTEKVAFVNAQGIAITTTQKALSTSGLTGDRVNLAQYIRAINILTLNYKNYKPKFTGKILTIDNTTNDVLNSITVYGGDTYTQKTIRKITYWQDTKIADINYVMSSFVTYYAQNRVNAQLFFTNKLSSLKSYNLSGSKSIYSYLFPFALQSELIEEQFNYEKSYLAQSPIQDSEVYDFFASYPSVLKTRIYYSEAKPVGSFYDGYRKIRALNFVDLQQKNGEIVAIFDVGERIVVIQDTMVSSIPYSTETLIRNNENIDIFVGDGKVYGGTATPISLFGASIKSATLKGFNTNGNAQVYWLSHNYKNINRYDYSGTKILTDQNSMRTFLNNNVEWIRNEFDVNLCFDINKSDVIITARANKQYAAWELGLPYLAGDYVTYQRESYPENFEQNIEIFRAKNNVTDTLPPPNDPTNWEFIPFTNNLFYNYWTLIFNETRNYFTTFFSPSQKRYFNHNKKILSPRGISSFGRIYEMNVGNELQFFEEGGVFKQGEFQLETIVNGRGDGVLKNFLVVALENGENQLVEATVTTSTDTLSSVATSYEKQGVSTYYPIQPSGDESLYGSWLKVSVVKRGILKLRNIITRYNSRKNSF
jgi:hypothetical protein